MLKPTRRTSLPEVVINELMDAIRDGTYSPGDRLPSEQELMGILGVGRSSIREAIRVLVVLGVVDTKPGRGAIVLPLPSLPSLNKGAELALHLHRSAMLDLLEMREAIEGQAALLAAARATPADLAELDRCMQLVEERVVGGRNYFKANLSFHLAVAKASRNAYIIEGVQQLLTQLRSFHERLMTEDAAMRDRDVAEHRAIVEGIRRRDGEQARAAAIAHMVSSAEAARGFATPTAPKGTGLIRAVATPAGGLCRRG